MKIKKKVSAYRKKSIADFRSVIMEQNNSLFVGKADPLIRAARVELDENYHGKITVFDFENTVAIAALVRLGVPPANAAAAVDQGYVVPVRLGEKTTMSWMVGRNFEPIDSVTLSDGSEYAIFVDDLPALDGDSYDCWAVKNGAPVPLGAYDPTEHLQGMLPYRHLSKRANTDAPCRPIPS